LPQYEFCVSLRISHPTLTVSEISRAMALEPDMSHNSGESRVSKKGVILGGVHKETFWSFDLSPGKRINAESVLFEDFITQKNRELSIHSAFLKNIQETGGCVDYFVGWFSDGSINMNIYLDPDLMKRTSELGISIVLCAYPGYE